MQKMMLISSLISESINNKYVNFDNNNNKRFEKYKQTSKQQ